MAGEGGISTTINVKGADQLVRSLGKASKELADLRDANERAGAIIARTAQAYAPKRTGALAGSIRPMRQTGRVQVIAGVRYSKYQELGTRVMPAHPFLRRAAPESMAQWLPEYERNVQAVLSKVRGA